MSPQEIPVQVIIPYQTLEELLQAGIELKSLRADVKRLREQNSAMRYMLLEIMEKVKRND